jgi:hypothetical protein
MTRVSHCPISLRPEHPLLLRVFVYAETRLFSCSIATAVRVTSRIVTSLILLRLLYSNGRFSASTILAFSRYATVF